MQVLAIRPAAASPRTASSTPSPWRTFSLAAPQTAVESPAPPGREAAKTFRGRGDGVLGGGRTLEEHSRRGSPLKSRIERIPRQRQQRPRGGSVRTYSREVNADISFNKQRRRRDAYDHRTRRPLMMRMATRKDSSSVHAPLSRNASRCRAARTSGLCACGVWRRPRRAGGMRRIACCIT